MMKKHIVTSITATLIIIMLVYFPSGGRMLPPLSADDVKIHPDAGKTSAAFLKIGAGARAAGMANAFSGISDDATAIYWNPAGLAFIPPGVFEINASHNEWFESIKHDFVGFAYRKKDSDVSWGGAFYGLYIPSEIERRAGINENDPFEPLTPVEGYFGAYDMAISVGAGYNAQKISRGLYLGGSVKIINQTIDDVAGWGAAFDAGGIYHFKKGSSPFSFAALFQNIGTPIKLARQSYPLPFTFRMALSYKRKISDENRPLNISFETAFPVDNYPFFHLGAEYYITKIFAVRAGYRYRLYALELGDISGLAAGAGMKIPFGRNREDEISLDYAFNPYGELGNSHRISASLRFGAGNNRSKISVGKLKQQKDNNTTGAAGPLSVKSPPLPSPMPSEISARLATENSAVFHATDITFKPKIVSNISTIAEFIAEPVSADDKKIFHSIRGILKTRTLPSDKTQIKDSRLLEIAALHNNNIGGNDNKPDDMLELFFKSGMSGTVDNFSVIISLPSDRKIKSVRTRDRTGGRGKDLTFSRITVNNPDGKEYYEIKSPVMTDMTIDLSGK